MGAGVAAGTAGAGVATGAPEISVTGAAGVAAGVVAAGMVAAGVVAAGTVAAGIVAAGSVAAGRVTAGSTAPGMVTTGVGGLCTSTANGENFSQRHILVSNVDAHQDIIDFATCEIDCPTTRWIADHQISL